MTPSQRAKEGERVDPGVVVSGVHVAEQVVELVELVELAELAELVELVELPLAAAVSREQPVLVRVLLGEVQLVLCKGNC